MSVQFSEVESRRFSKRVFRGTFDDAREVNEVLAAAIGQGAELLIVRCAAERLGVIHLLERRGFRLMDTLVYYRGSTVPFTEMPSLPGGELRRLRAADLPALQAVAAAAFADYGGHYHSNPRLDRRAATEGYVERFTVSTGDPSVTTLVACLEDRPVGFLTLRRGSAGKPADIDLNAVQPQAQRRGIYGALFRGAGFLAREGGDAAFTVSTNLSNLAPQKVWQRNGLELVSAFHTFHGWVDELGPGAAGRGRSG